MTDTNPTAEHLAQALDAACAHPTGTPNQTQIALAERMAAWLAQHPDRSPE